MIKSIFQIAYGGSRVLLGSLLFVSLSYAQLTYPDAVNPHGKPDIEGVDLYRCEDCHSTAAVDAKIHPMFELNTSSPKLNVPEEFPLLSNGSMSCMTCHEPTPKLDRANRSFLRGGPYRRDMDFCFVCHQASNFEKTNPHLQIRTDGTVDESACLHCHAKQPTPEDHPTIAREMHLDMTATCNKCHALHTHQQDHQGLNLKTSQKATIRRYRQSQRQTGIELPITENVIGCNTCHYTHQRGTLAGDAVVYEGDGENLHFLRLSKEKLCYACHDL